MLDVRKKNFYPKGRNTEDSDISDIFFLPKLSSFDFLINADKDSCCRVRSFVISKGFFVKSIVLKMWLRSSSLLMGRLGKKVLKKCEGSLLTSSKISLEKLIEEMLAIAIHNAKQPKQNLILADF